MIKTSKGQAPETRKAKGGKLIQLKNATLSLEVAYQLYELGIYTQVKGGNLLIGYEV
jgi:hypothetical protein